MNREEAFEILKKYVKSDSLIKHALAVEAGMIGYGGLLKEDVEKWSITGLIHDIDYEMYPNEHPYKGQEILKSEGFDEDIIYAVKGHADYTETDRVSSLDKGLYAVDELASFIVACVLVRPSRSFDDLEVKSVKKKIKDKAFAKGVDRDLIKKSAEEFDMDLTIHIENMIGFLKNREKELKEMGYSLIE
ncbi:HDIG domain-containing metalloprotein [Alkaliphilus peptidifermentans]|uniref:Metal dependent phosphohydrolase n=1 Tax=Alkaliphilus peptidifermentans DSM 18978 TaxID=1120976 RepID=A0A1G5FNB5_9FIRM|nr:HDIG domain-containing metalloprotein [Alkaliphilus peptidifermentans]SCY40654.1 metal dependent phosphohydrolase [Alkaliphilus peptidifermentans DSM 18978]